MLRTWKILPKGLLLYCDNFLFSDERKLTFGLILQVFPIFTVTLFSTYWKGHYGTSLCCYSDGLAELLVAYISGFCDFYL